MRNKIERRAIKLEVRAKSDPEGVMHLEGHAAVFNQEARIKGFYERVAPGAFKRCLSGGPDVRCLFNHDPNFILGRSASNTLTVSEDEVGLRYDCTPGSSAIVQHVREAVERGDVDGSSFGFIVRKDEWNDEKDERGRVIKVTRTILDADIDDVSLVTYPAYTGTTAAVSMRSLWPGGMPAEVRAHRAADDEDECECECPECLAGNCAGCSDDECGDPNCTGHGRSAAPTREMREKKTKRIDGEDLSASAFLIVGDPQDTSGWKLPWKFSSEEKTVSHLRNALTRFSQLRGVSDEAKSKAWAKLGALCKAHDIAVSEESSAAPYDVERAKAVVRAINASL